MLELGTPNGAAPAADLIKDGTEAGFMADVIDASQNVPVIVDFWAPWCGPCKSLGPALEAEVKAARGKARMVKINVDENQMIAQQLRIQSIPTVYAFVKGRPVDAFQGALPPAEIRAFIEKAIKSAGGDPSGGLDDAVEAAEEMLDQGQAVDAAQTFAAILGEDPNHGQAYAGLVRAHLALDDTEQAELLIANAPAEIAKTNVLDGVKAQLELARQAASAGPVAELRATVAANPDDLQARFDLATALHASGAAAEAIDELLDLFRRDREWNDGAARAQLFKIFDAMKPQDPVVLKARRRLSSMIFA